MRSDHHRPSVIPIWQHRLLDHVRPSPGEGTPLVFIVVILTLAGIVLLGAQAVYRTNSVPSIGISEVTTAEVGCSPRRPA